MKISTFDLTYEYMCQLSIGYEEIRQIIFFKWMYFIKKKKKSVRTFNKEVYIELYTAYMIYKQTLH